MKLLTLSRNGFALSPASERFDLSLPAIGALHAEGRVRGDFDAVDLIEVSGNLGASQFAFDATVDVGGERAHIGLTAALQQLDLSPFVNDGAATEQPTQASESGDIELGTAIDMLDNVDADLLITASRILGAPVDLDAVEIKATITSGNVELHSLAANVLGGNVIVAGSFDNASECPEINLIARGRDFDPATLNERLGGHVDAVNLDISSCGRTLFAHRDSLRAEIGIMGGRMSLGDEPFPLAADSVQLNTEPGERSRVRLVGKIAGESINATLVAGSLEALMGPDTWPINLDARGAGGQLKLGGHAGFASGNAVLDALVEFEAPRIGTLHSWTAVSPEATIPLRAETRLRFDRSTLVAEAIALSLCWKQTCAASIGTSRRRMGRRERNRRRHSISASRN